MEKLHQELENKAHGVRQQIQDRLYAPSAEQDPEPRYEKPYDKAAIKALDSVSLDDTECESSWKTFDLENNWS
jgi:hypothetical protein